VTVSGLLLRIVDQLFCPCHSTVDSLCSVTRSVTRVCNTALVAPLTDDPGLPDCGDECKRSELVHDMRRVRVEWRLLPSAFCADTDSY
jgi:hypothetical protein